MSDINLSEKRKKALEKLRENIGKSELKFESLSQAVKENIGLFANIKEDEEIIEFANDLDFDEDEDNSEISEEEIIINLAKSPNIGKAKQKIEDKQAKLRESSQRLKETRAKIREIRKQHQQQPKLSDLQQQEKNEKTENISEEEIHHINRHQLKEDLLTVDFWQQASQWLSSISTDIHLNSSPPEEVELLYKQAKHRYKALQLMLEDTQRELDAFEVYFRNLESLKQGKNKKD